MPLVLAGSKQPWLQVECGSFIHIVVTHFPHFQHMTGESWKYFSCLFDIRISPRKLLECAQCLRGNFQNFEHERRNECKARHCCCHRTDVTYVNNFSSGHDSLKIHFSLMSSLLTTPCPRERMGGCASDDDDGNSLLRRRDYTQYFL